MDLAKVFHVSKSFGDNKVLDSVDFSVQEGEILGVIGPNGSGKTTLLNIMMGMIKPESGLVELSCRVGMSVSRKGFFGDMTVRKNIEMYSGLMVNPRNCDSVFKDLMIDFGDLRFGKLSAGMKQKVSLACGLIADSSLLLLDEPINHLDIDAILALRKVLLERKDSGKSALLTSHILSDLEKVCDRVLFLKGGHISGNYQTSHLIAEFGTLENAYQNLMGGAKTGV